MDHAKYPLAEAIVKAMLSSNMNYHILHISYHRNAANHLEGIERTVEKKLKGRLQKPFLADDLVRSSLNLGCRSITFLSTRY